MERLHLFWVYLKGIFLNMQLRVRPAVMLLALGALCACGPGQRAEAQEGKIRVMTYNIQWFSPHSDPGRIANLKDILNQIRPNIVAVQEVEGVTALRQVFGDEWSLACQDNPKEFQEPAIAVRKPLKIVESGMVFTAPTLDYAFPEGRDVMRAVIQLPSGQNITVYSAHLKSRRGGRMETDAQRMMAAGMIASYIAAKPEEKAIVMGDFNDSPDDASSNILETGNLLAPGGTYKVEKPLMINLTEPLYRKDYVTIDLSRKWFGEPIPPVVAGAYEDNERLRGRHYDFPNDVKVTQTMFDNILITPNLAPMFTDKIEIFSGNAALRGSNGRVTKKDDGSVTYDQEGTRASDHLPVFADFNLN